MSRGTTPATTRRIEQLCSHEQLWRSDCSSSFFVRETSIRFGSLTIDEFPVSVGDAIPANGPPIGIGNTSATRRTVFDSVDRFEAARPERKRRTELLLSGREREELLLRQGYSQREIDNATNCALCDKVLREHNSFLPMDNEEKGKKEEEENDHHNHKSSHRLVRALDGTCRVMKKLVAAVPISPKGSRRKILSLGAPPPKYRK